MRLLRKHVLSPGPWEQSQPRRLSPKRPRSSTGFHVVTHWILDAISPQQGFQTTETACWGAGRYTSPRSAPLGFWAAPPPPRARTLTSLAEPDSEPPPESHARLPAGRALCRDPSAAAWNFPDVLPALLSGLVGAW